MGNIKMKFAIKLLVSFTVMMTLLSLIESRRALPPMTLIVREGGVCQEAPRAPEPRMERIQKKRPSWARAIPEVHMERKIKIEKIHEVGPQPGGRKTILKCDRGLVCAPRNSQRHFTGVNYYCQRPDNVRPHPRPRPPRPQGPAQLGEVCSSTAQRIMRKCAKGLSCGEPFRGDYRVQLKGATLRCQIDPPAKLGEVCSSSTRRFTRECAKGLVCGEPEQPEEETLPNGKIIKRERALGFDLTCHRAREVAEEGEVCSRSTPGFKRLDCADGLTCRPRDEARNLSGVSSYCLPPAEDLAQEGEVCYRPTPGFKSRNCELGLVCRVRDGDEMLKGVSSICQPPKIHIKQTVQQPEWMNHWW